MHRLPQRKNSRGGSKLASRFVLTATTVVAASTAITVLASTPAMADTPAGPDRTQIISEFYDWWTPAPYDSTDDASRIATAFKGDVTAAGAPVLAHNDAFVQAINHAGEQNSGQQLRALEDADMIWTETLGDAFGPVLSSYLTDGVSQGALPLTSASIEDAGKNSTTGTSKTDFNFPRPFLRTDDSAKGGVGDRSRNGENNLQGLSPQLDIRRVADQGVRPDNGEIHSAGYDIFAGVSDKGPEGINQAFPSGHTTYAYGISLQLAELLPELAPEIITRGSEAANNRIVLGVHYPLDIMGGRVEGHVNTATRLSDADYISSTLLPARAELVNYLESRCAADGHGDTLHACIADTDANNAGGYTNTFTDPVSTAAVVDRSSALTAYTSRMTYGFDRTSAAGLAPVVPENAESLLVTAFPALNDAQRRAVLAATEIDSGFPFSSSSQGWQRINLPAALSSRVTVDLLDNVVKVEPGQGAPSVVNADLPGNGAGSVTGSLVGRV